MNRWAIFSKVACLAASLALTRATRADDRSCTKVTRENVVSCALATSMTVRAEERGVRAGEGKRTAASVFLPSNPSLSLTLGTPTDLPVRGTNTLYSATLSQELEIAGQRGARVDAAEAQQGAQRSRLLAARRDVAAAALAGYFDQLAAASGTRIAGRLANLAHALKGYSTARAQIGLSAPVDAVLAESEAIQLTTLALEAEQRLAETSTALTMLVGLDPLTERAQAEGTLTPMELRDGSAQSLASGALVGKPEILAAVAEQRAEEARARVLRRMRIPNPTISLFARKDWLEERAVGIGISFPIPLPSPVGRTNAGEIAEAEATAERKGAEAEQLRRETKLQVVQAAESLARRKQAAERFDPEVVRKAEEALDAIADELAVHKLALRDALVMQRSLIDLLFGHIEARRRFCLASVELARVAGFAFEGSAK